MGVSDMSSKFEITLSKKQLSQIKGYLKWAEIDTTDMTEEDLVNELFFLSGGYHTDPLDMRGEVGIRRI